MIHFITGNNKKFEELAPVIAGLAQLPIDLPEIQDIDSHVIIRHKLEGALAHAPGEYIVEDSSLYLDCLGGKLPGPLIKWFEKVLGNKGLFELCSLYKNFRAEAITIIGYASSDGQTEFFEGRLQGSIVSPRGEQDFGWGPIFVPDGHEKTFGEMGREEKHRLSMRGEAARKLKAFLEEHAL
jgi:inosine triphosphate pyrophosphatase